jgi:exosortase
MKKTCIVSSFLFILFFFAYYPIIYDLRDSVMGNDLAHHTPLVFAFSGFLIYRRRAVLFERWTNHGVQDRPVPLLFLAGLILNLVGQAAGVYYLAQLSMPLTLYGMACYLKDASFARPLIFPFAFLIFAFPIPGKIYTELVFPLKLLVTKISGALLTLLGMPVKIHGNIIEISSTLVGVADACSGLNSLAAILALSVFYSYLVIQRWDFRLAIVISALPLVIIVNIIRVTTTAIVTVKWGLEFTEGNLHSLWGIAVFIISVLGLLVIIRFFSLLESRISHG